MSNTFQRAVVHDDYYIISNLHENGLSVTHSIYPILSSEKEILLFKEPYDFDNGTTDPNSAYCLLSAMIKWDGCLDTWIQDESLHFCGINSYMKFTELFILMYATTASMIGDKINDPIDFFLRSNDVLRKPST